MPSPFMSAFSEPVSFGRRNAFTLIELLVVIGIIAILAALLFPAFSRVQASGKATECASNLRQIAVAINSYKADHEGATPNSWGNWVAGNTTRGYWYNALLGQGNPEEFLASTGSQWELKAGTAGTNYLGSKDVLVCPEGGYGGWGIGSTRPGYGMTALALWKPITSNSNTNSPKENGEFIPNKFFTLYLEKPSQWPLVMDADAGGISKLENPIESKGASERYTARHNDTANVLMADGHVEKVEYGDLRWKQSVLNDGSYY